jgi:hypothetical protein
MATTQGMLVELLDHVWSHNPSEPNGRQRYIVRAGARYDPGETGPGAEP